MSDLSSGRGRSPETLAKALVIVGATAVGKSAAALALAIEHDGEIVSLDSRQLYRGMDIGTAKPTRQERSLAAHHLIDVADPDAVVHLARVIQLAYEAIAAIAARGRLPILVGGTGQYVKAVTEGWLVPEVRPQPEFRRRLEEEAASVGRAAVHRRLAEVDPDAARRIHPHNLRRVIRALEVHQYTGTPITELQDRARPPFDFMVVGLHRERESLYDRIDRRVADMVSAGLEQEVRALLAAGHGFDLPAMSGLGYGEWRPYVEGTASLAAVVTAIQSNTRHLVRKQGAWFRDDDPAIKWIDADDGPALDLVVSDWLQTWSRSSA